jgi:hypothetical protein
MFPVNALIRQLWAIKRYDNLGCLAYGNRKERHNATTSSRLLKCHQHQSTFASRAFLSYLYEISAKAGENEFICLKGYVYVMSSKQSGQCFVG